MSIVIETFSGMIFHGEDGSTMHYQADGRDGTFENQPRLTSARFKARLAASKTERRRIQFSKE